MLTVFLIVVVIVGLAFLGLGFNIFFRKLAFPENGVGKNKKMKSLGIACVRCEEMKKFREQKKFSNIRLDIGKLHDA